LRSKGQKNDKRMRERGECKGFIGEVRDRKIIRGGEEEGDRREGI
jgi:hypothetical protein